MVSVKTTASSIVTQASFGKNKSDDGRFLGCFSFLEAGKVANWIFPFVVSVYDSILYLR